MTDETMKVRRQFLKSDEWDTFEALGTDQHRGVPAPPIEKPAPPDAVQFDLVPPAQFTVGQMPLIEAINKRRSRRKYADAALTLEELSFLLWSCQGIEKITPGRRARFARCRRRAAGIRLRLTSSSTRWKA